MFGRTTFQPKSQNCFFSVFINNILKGEETGNEIIKKLNNIFREREVVGRGWKRREKGIYLKGNGTIRSKRSVGVTEDLKSLKRFTIFSKNTNLIREGEERGRKRGEIGEINESIPKMNQNDNKQKISNKNI